MNYDWIDFYQEFADKLLSYKNNRAALIQKLVTSFKSIPGGAPKFPTLAKNGAIPNDIDPFTMFGIFNRISLTEDNKIKILTEFKKEFNIASNIPQNFIAVPTVFNTKATYYPFDSSFTKKNFDDLWGLFETALNYSYSQNGHNKNEFIKYFNAVISAPLCQATIGKLTIALFWIRPKTFLSLDGRNEWFILNENNTSTAFVQKYKNNINQLNGSDYLTLLEDVNLIIKNKPYNDFIELSNIAFIESQKVNKMFEDFGKYLKLLDKLNGTSYYNKYFQTVKKLNEDFDLYLNPDMTETEFNEKVNELNNNSTFTKKNKKGNYMYSSALQKFKEFLFENGKIKIAKSQTNGSAEINKAKENAEKEKDNSYKKADFLKEVYLTSEEYDEITTAILRKKNLILTGSPGVGKTFMSERLAYSLMGKKDESKIKFVQFHQSYSYEDFVMGYKPNDKGGFNLIEGPFYTFCKQAEEHPEEKFFFIIDEINRGNVSKIFGELLMLIEADKRMNANKSQGHSIKLLYKDEEFSVPDNLYIIGMMNTADRGLEQIDYALRRRFAFFQIRPAFNKEKFKENSKNANNPNYQKLIEKIILLNNYISKDESLGSDFEIGHSYFCTKNALSNNDIKNIVKYEILPLVKEYWFDNKENIEYWSKELLKDLGANND